MTFFVVFEFGLVEAHCQLRGSIFAAKFLLRAIADRNRRVELPGMKCRACQIAILRGN